MIPSPTKPSTSTLQFVNVAEWQTLCVDLLERAKKAGASQAEVSLHIDAGFSVTLRKGEVDTLEHQRGKSLNLTVYFGHHAGTASTCDFTPQALQTTLEKACHIARYTGEDPCMGLAEANLMAYDYPELNLYHPWNITPEDAIAQARECEQVALAQDKRITQCDGASVNTHKNWHFYANTHGFVGHYPTTYHSLSCALIAADGHHMHSDHDYTCSRDALLLQTPAVIAKNAAEKVIRRLGARRIPTRQCPVIFKASVARSLIGHFLSAISGGNLYRKSSFLLDQLGQKIFPDWLQIQENPHVEKSHGAAPFDSEGVITQPRYLVRDGNLEGYILNSYTARKLHLPTTGNSGGAHNIFVQSGKQDLPTLLKAMGSGLLVTELMGQGINIVTGDYSRGAFGFWVENGEIQFPVNEITIAGNLKELFLAIHAIGNDVDTRSSVQTGSIWVDAMKIAGE